MKPDRITDPVTGGDVETLTRSIVIEFKGCPRPRALEFDIRPYVRGYVQGQTRSGIRSEAESEEGCQRPSQRLRSCNSKDVSSRWIYLSGATPQLSASDVRSSY